MRRPLLSMILPMAMPRQTTVVIVVIALAADHGDAQGDGLGIVGHRPCLTSDADDRTVTLSLI